MSTDDLISERRNSSRADSVVRRIEERITEQALPAGHRLGTKDSLRREFNVAVATFNEAVRMLSSRGTIEIRPGIGGGLFVASPTAFVRLGRKMLELSGESVSVADSLIIREALEPVVIRDAARCRTRRDVTELRKILTRMDPPDLDVTTYLSVNWRLHRRMVEISPNLILRHMYLGLLDFVSHRVSSVRADTGLADQEGVQVHRDIVDAIEADDPELVEAAIEAHERLTANQRSDGEGT